MRVIAIALIVLGLAPLLIGVVGRTNPIASVVGMLAVTGGVVLFVVTKRRRTDWRA